MEGSNPLLGYCLLQELRNSIRVCLEATLQDATLGNQELFGQAI